jgi:hypothetical protein
VKPLAIARARIGRLYLVTESGGGEAHRRVDALELPNNLRFVRLASMRAQWPVARRTGGSPAGAGDPMQLGDRPRYPIHDLYLRPLEINLEGGAAHLRLLAHSNHLLRRFGVVELFRLPAGATFGPRLQPVADDAWVLESGAADLFWRDERLGSPTRGGQHRWRALPPLLWLVPFGVAFGMRCSQPCVLIRLSTHEQEGKSVGSGLPWPEDW